MNICAISFLFTASIVGSSDIFLRADARASGLCVSSADPASARYSRFLDKANLNREEIRKPTRANKRAIIIAHPPSFLPLPPPPNCIVLNIACEINAKIPTKIIETINNLTSRFFICVSSCAITASSSSSFSFSMMPFDNDIENVP